MGKKAGGGGGGGGVIRIAARVTVEPVKPR